MPPSYSARINAPGGGHNAAVMTTKAPVLALTVAGLAPLSTATADDLDRTIEDEMARQKVPGLSLAVVRKGEIIRLQAYGYGDLEWRARTRMPPW